jgi:hypothetical protein
MYTSKLNKPVKVTKSVLKDIEKVDKKLNKPKKIVKLVHYVLNEEDLKKWVETPKSVLNISKSDKMKEVIVLMTYLGLRVSEAINFD